MGGREGRKVCFFVFFVFTRGWREGEREREREWWMEKENTRRRVKTRQGVLPRARRG